MKSGGNARLWRWRRFIVDVLIGAATLAVAFAAIGTTTDVLSTLLISGALIGVGLMLEPNVESQPASDINPQPRQSTEPRPGRSRFLAMGRFDAVVVDAASV